MNASKSRRLITLSSTIRTLIGGTAPSGSNPAGDACCFLSFLILVDNGDATRAGGGVWTVWGISSVGGVGIGGGGGGWSRLAASELPLERARMTDPAAVTPGPGACMVGDEVASRLVPGRVGPLRVPPPGDPGRFDTWPVVNTAIEGPDRTFCGPPFIICDWL